MHPKILNTHFSLLLFIIFIRLNLNLNESIVRHPDNKAAFLKKGQKTPQKEIDKALKIKDEYFLEKLKRKVDGNKKTKK